MNISINAAVLLWHRFWPQLAKLYLLVAGAVSVVATAPRLYRVLYLGEPTTLANHATDMYICAAGIAILFMLARLLRA